MSRLRKLSSDVVTAGAVLLPVALIAGWIWLARHPDTRLLDRGLEWPPTRPAAEWFIAHYRPPTESAHQAPSRVRRMAPEGVEGAAGVEVVIRPPAGWEDLPKVHRATDAAPRVWLPAGTTLREAPDPGASVVHRSEQVLRLPRILREGDWYQVRWRDGEAWVQLSEDAAAAPPLGNGRRAPSARPARQPDPELLDAGREAFVGAVHELFLGPYRTWTDLAASARTAALDRVAAAVEPAYRLRTGLQPLGAPSEAILLYARRDSYESFLAREDRLSGLEPTGSAFAGIVALPAEGGSDERIADVLVHEIVHLLNRRAVGPMLPPWLDEGLADDLALARRDGSGRPLLGTVGGERLLVSRERHRDPRPGRVETLTTEQFELTGGLAALEMARRADRNGRMVPVERLLELPWEEFVGGGNGGLHYAQAFLLVRLLLDPEHGHAEGFRSYLAAVAAGGPATPEALEVALGVSLESLDRQLREWMATTAGRQAGGGRDARSSRSREPVAVGRSGGSEVSAWSLVE